MASASPDAAAATAAYTMLTSSFLAFPATALAGVSTDYAEYINALGGAGAPGVEDGIKIGQAAASDLIAARTGDRNESITFTPGPLTPGGWTFAPPPSLQSAQTPWVAVMKPFMLTSPSQFRVEPPPTLSSRRWAKEFNEIKAYGAANSTVRSPQQTAVALFWNANAANQSNQAFQDVAITHQMDLVDTARLLAMGNLIDSDAGIACWDSKYHYLFWRPIMAIRNAQIDGNPATTPDPNWTPLLTTPNHPEYPAAHTCLTGAEAEMYATVLGTHHIDVTIHGSADGTPNNWAADPHVQNRQRPPARSRQRTRLGRTALPRFSPRRPRDRPRRRSLDAPTLLPAHLLNTNSPPARQSWRAGWRPSTPRRRNDAASHGSAASPPALMPAATLRATSRRAGKRHRSTEPPKLTAYPGSKREGELLTAPPYKTRSGQVTSNTRQPHALARRCLQSFNRPTR